LSDNPLVFVVSDLHLGNRYCRQGAFLSWLDSLPVAADLILNGDTIDNPREPLPPQDQAVLDRLVAESHLRRVVWLPGNHDRRMSLDNLGEIRFEKQWEIDRELLITHGDELDDVMPRHGLFRVLFKVLHRCLIFAGFPNVHVAQYAKKWRALYRVLNDHVAGKAIRRAETLGFAVITCGHTHSAMELERDGRRYLNTGCWTEEPNYYLRVDSTRSAGERVSLCVVDESCRHLDAGSQSSGSGNGAVDLSPDSRSHADFPQGSSPADDAVGTRSNTPTATKDSP
jgi:UDP-2,3-diacylglucosamine pyrophosphatase LpxH